MIQMQARTNKFLGSKTLCCFVQLKKQDRIKNSFLGFRIIEKETAKDS